MAAWVPSTRTFVPFGRLRPQPLLPRFRCVLVGRADEHVLPSPDVGHALGVEALGERSLGAMLLLGLGKRPVGWLPASASSCQRDSSTSARKSSPAMSERTN